MAQLLRMPEVAANTNEAVLGSWQIGEGASFAAGAVLATVETAKAAVDIEAEQDGVLVRALVDEGSEVAVGDAIALLAGRDEPLADADAELEALLGEPGAGLEPPAPDRAATPSRLFMSPLARRLARDAGIDGARLRGTGPNNRIVRRDVVAAIAAEPSAPPAVDDVGVPHTRMRAAIAASLVASKRDVPHFYLRGTADVDKLLRLRADLNSAEGPRISVNDLVLKAVGLAHVREPAMNVMWTDTDVRTFDTADVSLAIATEGGLVVPVVHAVETLRISALAEITADLAERARAGTLRQRELEGGTTTLTNLGMFGTEEFAAIINPPQSSIVAVGAVRQAAVVRDGQVRAAPVLTVTVSVDHRPIDGVVAARWLRELIALLENPVHLLR
jgi:pyruvate dehydrogenase E2 component (dihydrolipoamide acetyltransferase)